jgi:hypothetical protein
MGHWQPQPSAQPLSLQQQQHHHHQQQHHHHHQQHAVAFELISIPRAIIVYT